MLRRTWVTGSCAGTRNRCRTWGRRSVSGSSCWKSPSLRPSRENARGALPLKNRVSTSAMRSTPSSARRTTTQSLPGPRRRRVSQPSAMEAGAVGWLRLCRCEKYMSLQSTTTPPCSRAARSSGMPQMSRGSGTGSPCTCSRATPPSGEMVSRTWVMRAGWLTLIRCLWSPESPVLAPSGIHCASASSSAEG